MNITEWKIGNRTVPYPIVQGAMGVGVSLSSLAASVANAGGIGMISGVQIGFDEPDFEQNPMEANIRALRKHIRLAKELSKGGVIGVNLLVAIRNYKEMVKAAVDEKVDLIVSGAGLPKDLPKLVEGSDTLIAPIVSSGKGAGLIAKMWDRRYGRLPDAVVVEGPEAGGHLGFNKDELSGPGLPSIYDLIEEVKKALIPFEEKIKKEIPVIAAGGIFDGKESAEALKRGAAAVQIGSRFVGTYECDAHPNFKNAYIDAKKEDIELVISPVGMPGRAVKNPLTEQLKTGRVAVERCYNCLIPCDPKETPYCISDALIRSVKGDVEKGLIFAGSNAYRVEKIQSVKEVFDELIKELMEA